MSTNALLDIAIGLALTYLVVSLFGTIANEFISTLLKLRARTLQGALTQMLDDPVLRRDFYDHGLIASQCSAIGNRHPSYLSGQTFALAVLGSLDPTKPVPGFADIQQAIQNMPDSNIRDTLLVQAASAQSNLDALRTGLATHFDETMDRVGGVYKRYLKYISLGVGVVLVTVLNVDTITISRSLWSDASLRAQLVQNAGTLLKANPLADKQIPAGAPVENKPADKSDLQLLEEKLSGVEASVRPLPLGWGSADLNGGATSWTWKALGLFLSAVAVSLGAPFWFDLLSKFMNLRGAGQPPQRTDNPDKRRAS